jgi:hypothetical protein
MLGRPNDRRHIRHPRARTRSWVASASCPVTGRVSAHTLDGTPSTRPNERPAQREGAECAVPRAPIAPNTRAQFRSWRELTPRIQS